MIPHSAVRFLIVGLLNTVISYGVYCGLLFLSVYYITASIVGYCLAMINSYILNKIWSFRDFSKYTSKNLIYFILVNFFSLFTNVLILYFLIEFIFLNKYFAQLVALFFSTFINYAGCKKFVFSSNQGNYYGIRSYQ